MLHTTDAYYPLGQGFSWKYQTKDGTTYTNAVTGLSPSNPQEFTMVNSLMNKEQIMRKEGDSYLTDAFEDNNLQVLLKDNLQKGDTWEIKFKANGLDSILVMTVKEVGITKEVKGKSYDRVAFIEAESKLLMNGNLMPLNFFTQYYYAQGIGLILTTTSMGDEQALIDYTIA